MCLKPFLPIKCNAARRILNKQAKNKGEKKFQALPFLQLIYWYESVNKIIIWIYHCTTVHRHPVIKRKETSWLGTTESHLSTPLDEVFIHILLFLQLFCSLSGSCLHHCLCFPRNTFSTTAQNKAVMLCLFLCSYNDYKINHCLWFGNLL